MSDNHGEPFEDWEEAQAARAFGIEEARERVRRRQMLGGEGILTDDDLAALSAGCRRVHALIRDGRWHSASEIRSAAGTNGSEASEGLRRLRELRSAGLQVERRRSDGRSYDYRLTAEGGAA